MIKFHFNWKHVSAIASLTRANIVHDGAIKRARIIKFSRRCARGSSASCPFLRRRNTSLRSFRPEFLRKPDENSFGTPDVA